MVIHDAGRTNTGVVDISADATAAGANFIAIMDNSPAKNVANTPTYAIAMQYALSPRITFSLFHLFCIANIAVIPNNPPIRRICVPAIGVKVSSAYLLVTKPSYCPKIAIETGNSVFSVIL